MFTSDYIEKVYAGFLAMNAGIRLGAPVEPTEWTPEYIQKVYGEVTDYVKDYKVFSADDDANGPIFLVRSLIDKENKSELTPEDVADAWLNYSREGIGMFWWGGHGVSTEHTAYNNLIKGINAPQSGSVEVNGTVLSEQVGGQIFVDTWGWLFPGNIEKAADYAEIAASVSHDGEGLYGARFIAACISSAFVRDDISTVIQDGLSVIPKDSVYADVVNAVLEFHENQPDDFMACRDYLESEWGYDKYPGVCHIIPNAGACVLSLIYGQGSISKTIEIATMCGWDTDSNGGVVGSIVGTLNGINNFPENYRKPMNDRIVASSVSGYKNIVDIPTFIKEIALLAYEINGETAPEQLVDSFKKDIVYYDFNLKGSTHGFEAEPNYKVVLNHREKEGFKTNGVLEIFLDRFIEGEMCKVFTKTFYRRKEFNDEKYKPTFAPKAYPGQEVNMKLFLEKHRGNEVFVTPYVLDTYTSQTIKMNKQKLHDNEWNHIRFTIPNVNGSLVEEVGFIIESPSPRDFRTFGSIYLDEFSISGRPTYEIDFTKQSKEFMSVTPFSHHNGEWDLLNGSMQVKTDDKEARSFTGHYYEENYELTSTIIPKEGNKHNLLFRSKGTFRGYEIGFIDEDTVALSKLGLESKVLKKVPYQWEKNKKYTFKVVCVNDDISFYVNGELVLEYVVESKEAGMVGLSFGEKAEATVHQFEVKGLQV